MLVDGCLLHPRAQAGLSEVELAGDHMVYFHNHGNPGPGVYLPESWEHNRAKFSPQGITLPDISHHSCRSPGIDSALNARRVAMTP